MGTIGVSGMGSISCAQEPFAFPLHTLWYRRQCACIEIIFICCLVVLVFIGIMNKQNKQKCLSQVLATFTWRINASPSFRKQLIS